MNIKTADKKNNQIIVNFKFSDRKEFDATLTLIKSIPGRIYNAETRTWALPLNTYSIQQLQKHGFTLAPEINKWKEQQDQPVEIITPNGLQLYPFQKQGLGLLEKMRGRALLADEMGLGKTIQAIGYIKLHPELRPVLIIVPASLKLNWAKEFKKWMPEEKNIQIVSGKKDTLYADIIIMNYDIAAAYMHHEKIKNILMLIIDECHMIKNMKAQRTKAVHQIAKKIKHIIAISGTPIINRPIEFFPTLSLISPNTFNNQWRFAQEFCNPEYNGFGWNYKGATNTEKLNEILKSSIMIRRLKKDVLKELPLKIRSIIPIEIENKKQYKAAEKDFIQWIKEEFGADASAKAKRAEAISKINYLKQLAAELKLNAAIEWIENFIEEDKLVVFCTHHKIIDTLMDKFMLQAVKLDGRNTIEQRQHAINEFQTNEDCRLFIGNIKAAGVGLTLTAAHSTAFVELGWTPGEHDQAEDRVHRIGQEADSVSAYYLIGLDTIEENICALIDEKRKTLDAIMDGAISEEDSLLTEILNKYK